MNIRLVRGEGKVSRSDGARHVGGARREHVLAQLRGALHELFRLRHAGVAHAEVTRAQGLVDGYMRCLSDLGVATDREMLEWVSEARRGLDGPATTTLSAPGLEDGLEDARASA